MAITKARQSADYAAGGPQVAGKNAVINGGMDIWQRGTSIAFNNNTGYSADRWYAFSVPVSTISRQSTNDTTNLPNIQYNVRVQRNSGNTSTGELSISQSFETSNSIPYTGKTVTLSFYARSGANFSAGSSQLIAQLRSGTGTDQNLTSYTGSSNVINQTPTLTTTWQRFTYSATVGTTAAELGVYFGYFPTGTAGAADYFEITGVQLELGSVATTFSRAGGTIQGELAACQRYYWRSTGNGANVTYGVGISATGTAANICVINPVPMRIAPTSIDFSNLAIGDTIAYLLSVSTVTFAYAGTTSNYLAVTNAATATIARTAFLQNNNNTAGYIGLSAEL